MKTIKMNDCLIVNIDLTYALIDYLNILDIVQLAMVNSSIRQVICETSIHRQWMQLSKNKDDIFAECFERNFLKIIKNLCQRSDQIIEPFLLKLAAHNGYVEICEWYLTNYEYSRYMFDQMFEDAFENNQVVVLDFLQKWFTNIKSTEHPIYLPEFAFQNAASKGCYQSFNWYIQNVGSIENDCYISFNAAKTGKIAVLDWCHNANLKLKNTDLSIVTAVNYNQVTVLQWFFDHQYSFATVLEVMIYNATIGGAIEVLQWLHNHQINLNKNHEAVNKASIGGHLAVLDWHQRNGYDIHYTSNSIYENILNKQWHILQWHNQNNTRIQLCSRVRNLIATQSEEIKQILIHLDSRKF